MSQIEITETVAELEARILRGEDVTPRQLIDAQARQSAEMRIVELQQQRIAAEHDYQRRKVLAAELAEVEERFHALRTETAAKIKEKRLAVETAIAEFTETANSHNKELNQLAWYISKRLAEGSLPAQPFGQINAGYQAAVSRSDNSGSTTAKVVVKGDCVFEIDGSKVLNETIGKALHSFPFGAFSAQGFWVIPFAKNSPQDNLVLKFRTFSNSAAGANEANEPNELAAD